MMSKLVFSAVLTISYGIGLSSPLSTGDELNDTIKEYYDGKTFTLIKSIPAGEYQKEDFGPGDMGLVLHHFSNAMSIPEKVKVGGGGGLNLFSTKVSDLNQLDERTFEELKSGLNRTMLEKGERVKVVKFYMRKNYVDLYLTPLDNHLNDIDIDKAGGKSRTTISGNSSTTKKTINGFGLRFISYFDEDSVIKNNDSKAIIDEISQYLLPPKDAEAALAKENNIEINIGMSEDQLIQILGKPLKTISIGGKKIYKYEDLTVTTENGLVTDVKVQ